MSDRIDVQALGEITKNFNKICSNAQIQNMKNRSKSLGMLRNKSDQQNSIVNLKGQKRQMTNMNLKKQIGQKLSDKSYHRNSSKFFDKQNKSSNSSEVYSLYEVKIIQKKNSVQNLRSCKLENSKTLKIGQRLTPIEKGIKSLHNNQNQLVYLTEQGKIHSHSLCGKSLNTYQEVSNFFQSKKIDVAKIFCTPYSTFFVTNLNDLYGVGLNDTGQLGSSELGVLKYPINITVPFNTDFNQMNYQRQSFRKKSFQKQPQQIVKISGGPFHTVLLTNYNKVYYTGVIYGQSQLVQDRFMTSFVEIKVPKSYVTNIQCGLTSVVFLTSSGKVFVFGLFGQNNFYSSATELDVSSKSTIKSISIVNDCIYLITQERQLFKANLRKKIPIITEIRINSKFTSNQSKLISNANFSIQTISSKFGNIVFIAKQPGKEQENQGNYRYFIQLQSCNLQPSCNPADNILEINLAQQLKQVFPTQIFSCNDSLYFLLKTKAMNKVSNLIENFDSSQQMQNSKATLKQIDQYMKKIKQLQEENKKLKFDNISLARDKETKKDRKPLQKSCHSELNLDTKTSLTPRTFNNNLQIDFSQIKLTKKIAEGGYGIIYRGEWKKTEVAVKIFKIDQNNSHSVKQFISECRAMQALRHPNIVMYLGACMKKPNFAIVLEYCEGGTLWSILQNHKIQLSWTERFNFALQIAKAMNYLHDRKNPVVHRDLKSLNILLDSNRRVKLADFGWTKSLENYMTSKIGTYQWMAPEVLTGQQYTQKADVFSYSIILWEIAARQPPYRNINGLQVAYDVANKQFRPTIPINTPVQFEKLITRCWQKSAQGRPSFSQIIDILQKLIKNAY